MSTRLSSINFDLVFAYLWSMLNNRYCLVVSGILKRYAMRYGKISYGDTCVFASGLGWHSFLEHTVTIVICNGRKRTKCK